jgi:replicative DNA helicase
MEDWRVRTLAGQLAEIQLGDYTSGETPKRLREIVDGQERIQAYLGDTYTKDFTRSATEFCTELTLPDTSIKTGWQEFDRVVGGLQRKSVYVIAARPGKGKTDWALQLACRVAMDVKALYCTMEMPATQLMQRIASRCTKINSTKLRDKDLTEDERKRVFDVLDILTRKTQLSFDEEPALTAAAVAEKVEKFKPDVVFIDHLGLMDKGKKRNPWDAVADNCHALKALALAKDVAVVELVQLSRETDHRKTVLGDMYGGSAVEQDADAVFALEVEPIEKFLQGDESTGVTVEVLKNRHGGVGEMHFRWQPQIHCYIPEERST